MHRTTCTTASGIAFVSTLALCAAGISRVQPQVVADRPQETRIAIGENMISCNGDTPGLPVSACFAPGTPAEERLAVTQAMVDAWYAQHGGEEGGAAYELGTRWSLGGSSSQGAPVTIRWSIVPDGLFIPNGGLGSGSSNFQAKLATVFGSVENGRVKIREVFGAWHALTGITYTELASDDGAAFGTAGSSARGDVRIGGIALTNNNVLAYNYFPQDGDMVVNTGIGWGSSANNYRYFRNILMHEHGHGIGLAHVCPANSSKLMEPFISVNFDGPQHDDIRGGQRHYGDWKEPNDSSAAATAVTSTGTQSFTNISIDDNADSDWFKFTGAPGMKVTVKVQPNGFSSYVTGAETSQCNSGSNINTLAVQDLQISMYNPSLGLLFTQNSAAAGVLEQVLNYQLTLSGTHYVRIFPAGVVDNIQTYTITFIFTPAILGDLNGDGIVDGTDLGIMLGQWGGPGSADLNNSGAVDGTDLGLLLGAWG